MSFLTAPNTEPGQKNEVSEAEMAMTVELLGATLRGAGRYVLWFFLVELALWGYVLLDVQTLSVNFVVGIAALWAFFNPPARFEPSPFGSSQE